MNEKIKALRKELEHLKEIEDLNIIALRFGYDFLRKRIKEKIKELKRAELKTRPAGKSVIN